jgi:hypothetical protein
MERTIHQPTRNEHDSRQKQIEQAVAANACSIV